MLCDAHIVAMFVMTIFKKCPFLLVLTSYGTDNKQILKLCPITVGFQLTQIFK